MTRQEALDLIYEALAVSAIQNGNNKVLTECQLAHVESATEVARAIANEKPVAYFLYDGEMYSQMSEKYKNDSDVFPLYTNEVMG